MRQTRKRNTNVYSDSLTMYVVSSACCCRIQLPGSFFSLPTDSRSLSHDSGHAQRACCCGGFWNLEIFCSFIDVVVSVMRGQKYLNFQHICRSRSFGHLMTHSIFSTNVTTSPLNPDPNYSCHDTIFYLTGFWKSRFYRRIFVSHWSSVSARQILSYKIQTTYNISNEVTIRGGNTNTNIILLFLHEISTFTWLFCRFFAPIFAVGLGDFEEIS